MCVCWAWCVWGWVGICVCTDLKWPVWCHLLSLSTNSYEGRLSPWTWGSCFLNWAGSYYPQYSPVSAPSLLWLQAWARCLACSVGSILWVLGSKPWSSWLYNKGFELQTISLPPQLYFKKAFAHICAYVCMYAVCVFVCTCLRGARGQPQMLFLMSCSSCFPTQNL